QGMAGLSHPNGIAVHDVGTYDDQVFVVMGLVSGVTLRAWLAGTRHPWQRVRDVFVQAGRGLAAAHAAGLVHRDFKPENVLVGRDGRVRVMDFGLAHSAATAASATAPTIKPGSGDALLRTLTTTGALMGTPYYMAPE